MASFQRLVGKQVENTPEKISAKLVSDDLTYRAVRMALIAANEVGVVIFAIVQAHDRNQENLQALRSSLDY